MMPFVPRQVIVSIYPISYENTRLPSPSLPSLLQNQSPSLSKESKGHSDLALAMFQNALCFAVCVSVASCHTIFTQLVAAGKTNGKLKSCGHKRGSEHGAKTR
jgi:hypothetical protein